MDCIKKYVSFIMAFLIVLFVVYVRKSTLYSESITFSQENSSPIPVVQVDSFLEGVVKPDITSTDPGYCNKNFRVEIVETGAVGLTDENGRFSFFHVYVNSGNAVTAKISKNGYLARTISLKLNTINNQVVIRPGDMVINGVQDNAINISDIMAVAGLFNKTYEEPNFNPGYDLNGDQAINITDIMIVAKHFNSVAADYEDNQAIIENFSGHVTESVADTPTPTPALTVTPTSTATPTTVFGEYNNPEVVFLNKENYPVVPNRPGLWQPILNSTGSAPVFKWKDRIFTGFSFADNRNSMDIVEFDSNGNVVKEIEKRGSWCLESIDINPQKQEVNFLGKEGTLITMSLDELFSAPTPKPTSILRVNEEEPVVEIVDGANYPVPNAAELWQPSIYMMGSAPVLKWKGHTYTAFSYIDNRNAMDIVEVDQNGNIVKEIEKSGSRNLSQITTDNKTGEVIFWGENQTSITMSLTELLESSGQSPELPQVIYASDDQYFTIPDVWDLRIPGAPMLKWRGYTYELFGYSGIGDIRIVKFDSAGKFVGETRKSYDGSPIVNDITVDATTKRVYFGDIFAPAIIMPFYEFQLISPEKSPSEVVITAASSAGTEIASRMNDGNLVTKWKSYVQYNDTQWIDIDLHDTCGMTHMMIDWGAVYPNVYQVEALVNNKGKEEWITVENKTRTEINEKDSDKVIDRIELSTDTSRIRIKLNDNITHSSGYGIYEIELYSIDNKIWPVDDSSRGRIRLRRL